MTRRLRLLALVGTLLAGTHGHAQMLGLATGEGPGRAQAAGTRLTFVCVASDGKVGTVYGTDVYTAESAVCAAAIHAGVLQPHQPGAVTIVFGSGAKAFLGSERNGVTTRSYGAWDTSYAFARADELGSITWRTVWNKVPEDFTDPVTVVCPPNGTLDGAIWGTDVYTRDSSLCVAAVHAGAISTATGGAITVQRAVARDFPATERFGVASQKYGPYADAFAVKTGRAIDANTARSPAPPPAALPTAEPTTAQPPAAAIGPRALALGGFTVAVIPPAGAIAIAPRVLQLAGFTIAGTGAVGQTSAIGPRTIHVSGFTVVGSAATP